MQTVESLAPRPRPLTTVQRWLALIDHHGSENAALIALFRQVDELERLKRTMQERGLMSEDIAAETNAASI